MASHEHYLYSSTRHFALFTNAGRVLIEPLEKDCMIHTNIYIYIQSIAPLRALMSADHIPTILLRRHDIATIVPRSRPRENQAGRTYSAHPAWSDLRSLQAPRAGVPATYLQVGIAGGRKMTRHRRKKI